MKGKTFLFIGRPCAGKTSVAKEIVNSIKDFEIEHYDGDSFRKLYTPDLGFSEEERTRNLKILAEKCRENNKQGKTVFASFIAPTEKTRELIKKIVGEENFVLVYIKCSINECEKRDIKGMYAEARAGKRKNFTGIDSPFEKPLNPDLILDTENKNIEECVDYFLEKYFNREIKPSIWTHNCIQDI